MPGVALAASSETTSGLLISPVESLWSQVQQSSPALGRHPGLVVSAIAAASLAATTYWVR